MKKLILAGMLALSLAFPAAAQRAGTYDVTGANPDGTEYTGTLTLTQIGLATFRVIWTIGQDTIEGMGMVSGLTFATAFALGDQAGMGIYEIQRDGSLVGVWTTAGAFAQGRETARPR